MKAVKLSSFASTSLHDTHSSTETHAAAASSATSGGTTLATLESTFSKCLVLLTRWVTDCLVYR